MFRRVENLRMWAKIAFHGWVLRSLGGLERRERLRAATVGRERLEP
jgi:hypothetical protein